MAGAVAVAEVDPRIFDLLLKARRVFPDLRIGQLLEDAMPEGRQLYYVEDDDLIAFLDQYIRIQGARVRESG